MFGIDVFDCGQGVVENFVLYLVHGFAYGESVVIGGPCWSADGPVSSGTTTTDRRVKTATVGLQCYLRTF